METKHTEGQWVAEGELIYGPREGISGAPLIGEVSTPILARRIVECVNGWSAAQSELIRLREENFALKKDAERYQWLRDIHGVGFVRDDSPYEGQFDWKRGTEADSAIDSARAKVQS